MLKELQISAGVGGFAFAGKFPGKALARLHDLPYAARLHTSCPKFRMDEALS